MSRARGPLAAIARKNDALDVRITSVRRSREKP
jgi:hypothetical protein